MYTQMESRDGIEVEVRPEVFIKCDLAPNQSPGEAVWMPWRLVLRSLRPCRTFRAIERLVGYLLTRVPASQ